MNRFFLNGGKVTKLPSGMPGVKREPARKKVSLSDF